MSLVKYMSDFIPSAVSLRFAMRELRGGIKGFRIFIACIALGVAAISGVASLSRSLTEGINNEGQAILGGDISVSLIQREANPNELEYLNSLGAVSRIGSIRTMARVPDSDRQALVELKAIDNSYPLFGEVRLENSPELSQTLTKENGVWGAVVDQTLVSQFGLELGDEISIGEINIKVNDIIDLEPDRLSNNFLIGPRLMLSEQAFRESGLVQPGSLVTWRYRLSLDETGAASESEVSQTIQSIRTQFPDSGWRVRSRANSAPGLVNTIQRFAEFLTLVGITGLVVGGVGVANAVRSFLETKLRVIASFKCVGASGNFVFQVYLVQILILAGIGIGAGLILGAAIPIVANSLLGTVLPIPSRLSFYPTELVLGIFYGLLTALAFALLPLGRAHDIPATALFRDAIRTDRPMPRLKYLILTAITVVALAGIALVNARETEIALFYILASGVSFALLLFIAKVIKFIAKRVPKLNSTALRLAIGNIHRPGALTSSVVLSLGLGLTLLVSLTLIDGNIRGQLTGSIARNAPSFFFLNIQKQLLPEFENYLSSQAPNAVVEHTPMLRGRVVSINGIPAHQIRASEDSEWAIRGDRGITFTNSIPLNSTIIDGEWWDEDHQGDNLVSFESEVAEGLGLVIGDTITVNVLGREIKATISNFRKLEWRSLAINFVMVFSPNTFANAPYSHLATVTWPGEEDNDLELAFHRDVANAFPTVTAVRVKEAIERINSLVEQLAWAIRGVSSITLIASILVLAGALAAGHRNRIYDAVVLKTLGATRSKLLTAFIFEYMLLGATTALFAIIAGALAAWTVIDPIMDLSFEFTPSTAITAVCAGLILTVGFGLVGTWRILGEKAAPVLRNL